MEFLSLFYGQAGSGCGLARSPGLSVKAGCPSLVTSLGTRKLGSLCSRPGSGLPQLSSSSESHPEQTWASWTLSTCHPWATPRARMQLQRYSECLLATNSCLVIKQKEKVRVFIFFSFLAQHEAVFCLSLDGIANHNVNENLRFLRIHNQL